MTEEQTPIASPPSPPPLSDHLPDWVPAVLKLGLPVLLIAGIVFFFYFRNRVSTDDAQVDGRLVPVSCRIYGSVEKVWVEDNQEVKAGDPLVTLDPRDLQVKVDQARAAVAQAEAKISSAHADLDRSRLAFEQARGSDLQAAQANLEGHKASYAKARADLQRMQPLAERQEISALQFDAIRTQAEVAENEWKAAQRRASSVEQEAEMRKVNITSLTAKEAQGRAELDQAKASLEALKLQLSYAKILAPVDGVVTRKSVETGQIIQPGQGLLTLIPLHQTWVTANFKETQLTKVRPGQEAEVKVDMNGMVLHGHVDSIAGSTGSRMSLLPPENAVGNFVKVVQRIPVKIRIDGPESQRITLRPGMNVEATIITK
ncbi:MAG: HlyD family secretion protein [Acidobacteriota bacterium]|nr:HlyD family secretion protein [Acidobacteriota bacterium]